MDRLAGHCDLSHQDILVGEEHYIVEPSIGKYTQLQFKTSQYQDEIEKLVKSIYGDIPFSIKKKVSQVEINIADYWSYLGALNKIKSKYQMTCQSKDLVTKIIEILRKKNQPDNEKVFLKDMEEIGLLHPEGSTPRMLLDKFLETDNSKLLTCPE